MICNKPRGKILSNLLAFLREGFTGSVLRDYLYCNPHSWHSQPINYRYWEEITRDKEKVPDNGTWLVVTKIPRIKYRDVGLFVFITNLSIPSIHGLKYFLFPKKF